MSVILVVVQYEPVMVSIVSATVRVGCQSGEMQSTFLDRNNIVQLLDRAAFLRGSRQTGMDQGCVRCCHELLSTDQQVTAKVSRRLYGDASCVRLRVSRGKDHTPDIEMCASVFDDVGSRRYAGLLERENWVCHARAWFVTWPWPLIAVALEQV